MRFSCTYKGLVALAGIGLMLMLAAPVQAQFFDWGRPRYRSDPFRDFFGGFPRYEPRGGGEGGDSSHAPGPAQKKPEATTPIVVMGDANADWLAYGLEDAFSERPEIAIVRKHKTDSGLIRYDPRREIDWAQAAREIIAAEKPKYIVMMTGNNDRQLIREKAPPLSRPSPGAKPAAAPGAPAGGTAPAQAAPPQSAPPQGAQGAPPAPVDPEQQPPERAAEQPAPSPPTSEQARQAAYGPWEFHTEKWEIAYIKRVDAVIAALKSAGVPVFWVGLPSQRGAKGSADSQYLNEIYRSRADKAGITYVDIWDGFVDEGGRFSPQGPDYEGQIRRLRSADGVYFTKFGARKLAHYVEREVERQMVNRAAPVALPLPTEQGPQAPAAAKPGAPSQRPAVGPVLPLNALNAGSDELLGGARANRSTTPTTDASASRVLTKGEPISAPAGRADDFKWPRSSGVQIDTNLPPTPPTPASATPDKLASDAGARAPGAQANPALQMQQQRPPRSAAPQPFRMPFFLPFFR